MSKMAQERLEKNEDDLVGILVKAQVAINYRRQLENEQNSKGS